MFRKLFVWVLAFSFFCQPVYAFSLMDGASQKILQETWDAQTLSELENGVIAIPETAINDYLATVLPDHPDIRAVHVAIHSENQIALDVNTKETGRMSVQGTVTRFVQNSEESSMAVRVGKRQLLDKPLTSWFFAHISLGMLTKLFGNPLNGDADQFSTKISGNTLTVDFKPYVDQSPLHNTSFYGVPLAELFSVDSLTTDEGMVYLHTSYHGPALSIPAIGHLFGQS